jgi:hypothetical protein
MFLNYYFVLFFIDWCTVLILLCLFVCMCSCVAIDGAQFEDSQGQDFEKFPEQQQFANEGKWSLIMFPSY